MYLNTVKYLKNKRVDNYNCELVERKYENEDHCARSFDTPTENRLSRRLKS